MLPQKLIALIIFTAIFCVYSISNGQSWKDEKIVKLKERVGKQYWVLPNEEIHFYNSPDALEATESFFIKETESFVIWEWIPENLTIDAYYQIKFKSGKISYIRAYHFDGIEADIPIYIKNEDPKVVEERQKGIEDQQKRERDRRFNALRKVNGNGFQDIPFGASYEDVLAELTQRTQKEDMRGWVESFSDFIVITSFPLGDNMVKIFFHFDHKQEFYSLSFDTERLTANKFDSQIISNVDNLTQVFKNKYGKPAECVKPNFIFIREGYIFYVCKWQNKELKIFTGITVYEALYYAIGQVTSKKLEKAFESHKKQQGQKKATEDAKKF